MALFRSRRAAIRQVSLAAVLAASSLTAAPARAQDDDHQRAARAFSAARIDIDNGNCRAAIPKLEESISYEPSVGAHLSMADCYEQIDLLAAWRELKEAAALAMARNDERATVARDRAAGLEPRLATIKLVLPAEAIEAANADVRLDGNIVRPFVYLGGIIATTRGAHEIEVFVPHKKPWRQRVVIQTIGTPVPVVVAPEDDNTPPAPRAGRPAPEPTDATAAPAPRPPAPAPAPETPPPAAADEHPRSGDLQRTVGLAVGGAGVAGLLVGTIAGIVALSKNAQVRDACGGDVSHCTALPGSPSVTGPMNGAQSAATVSTVGLVLGGVFVASGAAIYFLAPPRHATPDVPPDAPPAARATPRALAVAPLAGDRMFGLSLRGEL